MTTLSEKFELLTFEYPEEQLAVSRLIELVGKSTKRTEYTLNRLADLLPMSSDHVLPLLLSSAVNYGLFERLFRVESPSNQGGIAEYKQLDEIPSELQDWRQDIVISVLPEYIRLIFKPQTLQE